MVRICRKTVLKYDKKVSKLYILYACTIH